MCRLTVPFCSQTFLTRPSKGGSFKVSKYIFLKKEAAPPCSRKDTKQKQELSGSGRIGFVFQEDFSCDMFFSRRGVPEALPEFTDEEGSDSEDSDGDPSSDEQGCEEESSSSDEGLVALKARSNTAT